MRGTSCFLHFKKMEENLEQQYTLKFYLKLGKTAKESKDMLQQAYGDSLKPSFHPNVNGTQMRHAKTKPSFNVDLLLRRSKHSHLAVRKTVGKQPNAIRPLSVHQKEFTCDTFM